MMTSTFAMKIKQNKLYTAVYIWIGPSVPSVQ